AADADYDPWLHEIHHRRKRDAPSGTLRELRRGMERAGYAREIDAASNRAGPVPGTHLVGFDSEADTIRLEHQARGRAGFARGALRAARWVLGRRGVFEWSEVWEDVVRGGSRPDGAGAHDANGAPDAPSLRGTTDAIGAPPGKDHSPPEGCTMFRGCGSPPVTPFRRGLSLGRGTLRPPGARQIDRGHHFLGAC